MLRIDFLALIKDLDCLSSEEIHEIANTFIAHSCFDDYHKQDLQKAYDICCTVLKYRGYIERGE